jgi:general stress protein 26
MIEKKPDICMATMSFVPLKFYIWNKKNRKPSTCDAWIEGPGDELNNQKQKRSNQLNNADKTIGDLIDNASATIISSIDESGFPNTKAMLPPRKRDGIKTIFLTTNTSSMRVKQYTANPKACIYFYDKRFFKGVMLKGNMEVLQDTHSKEMIWKDGDEMYYPKGVSDPDYCVLKFTAHEGRYYSNFKSETFDIIS